MKVTRTFNETTQAYLDGFEFISNRGSSRSGKTFATLQLLYTIMKESKKRRKITVVSMSYPHLRDGAIYDFEEILLLEGENIDAIRNKSEHEYRIGVSLLQFVSLDKPGKALGAARDILFANEANKIPYPTINQLEARTKECTFIDYNPDGDFWLEENDLLSESNAIEIHSTYIDNYENLSEKQKSRFTYSKRKADKEEADGVKSYWYYWWQCYGLGLRTRMVDKMIFPKCKEVSGIPSHARLLSYGVDFSNSENQNSDPHSIVGIWYADNSIYIKGIYEGVAPVLYQENGNITVNDSFNSLASICHYKCPGVNQFGERPFIADGANEGNIKLIANCDILVDDTIYNVDIEPYERPYTVLEGFNKLNSFENIYLVNDCKWLVDSFIKAAWEVDKNGVIQVGKPSKAFPDHAVAAARYAIQKWALLSD